MKSNLISIITPCYNSAKFIKETIESVKNQTYKHWEMILIDDNSTDNTVKIIIHNTRKDKRFRLIKLKINSGAAIARNQGIKAAKGDYIAFLDSDDRWHQNKLSLQIKQMQKYDLSFTFTDYFVYQDDQRQIPFTGLLDEVKYHDIIKFNYIACSTVVFSVKDLGKVYMPDIRNRQDWALWISLIKKCSQAIRINEKLMFYRIHEKSISNNKQKLVKYHWYIYRNFLGYSFPRAFYMLSRNILLHIINSRK